MTDSEILLDHKVVKFLDEMKNVHLEGIFVTAISESRSRHIYFVIKKTNDRFNRREL